MVAAVATQWLAQMEAAYPRRRALGYDAVTSRGKRREATGLLRSEEQELPGSARRKLVSQTRDAHRNFTIAGWAIRRHLDYVTSFRFQSRTGRADLDRKIEELHRRQSEAPRADVAARHPFDRMIRLAEMRRVLDGDCGILKLKCGRLQAVEGDRIRSFAGEGFAPGPNDNGWNWFDHGHGVRTDKTGRALWYSVCSRTFGGGFKFERWVSARDLYLHAQFDRFDQLRGISPLAPGLNTMVDTYEGIDYALAKAKVAQLFALAFYRESAVPLQIETKTEPELDENGNEIPDGPRYEIDLGRGPLKLELEDNDRAEFLSNDSPGPSFQEFVQVCVSIALKALDIPFSFYDEAYTNYSGARQALLQYQQSARERRKDVRALLDHITAWWTRHWERRGLLPKSVRAEDVRWHYVHAGLPWIDPLNEIQANIAAISAGLASRTQVLAEQGIDFVEIVEQLAYETETLAAYGLPTDVQAIHALIPKVANGDDQTLRRLQKAFGRVSI